MAESRLQIQAALQRPYDRILFAKEVLSPVFGSTISIRSSLVSATVQPNNAELKVIDTVLIYGSILLEDKTEITCYEIALRPEVQIEQSKVAIQRYVRRLLTVGQVALVNFISPLNKNVWRLTLVAKDSDLTADGVKEKGTNAKRYTYLLGPNETCKTVAERFETLSTEKKITFQSLINAFSVEKLSKAFFDEYTLHYQGFCDYLQTSNFRKSAFNISISSKATKEEKDKAFKPVRDFVKKLLGRIVFLYFVQKKGWLGASNTSYNDGPADFVKQLFTLSGSNGAFYSSWLTVLFFDTLNRERVDDDFKMPDGKKVKIPFLNGGLFDKGDYDENLISFDPSLFHHPDLEDTILTPKNRKSARGFLDFLNSFNFTVHEDSPDDHTVAVDPEMLGHIFENLLEDNKDKGTFYTPKEVVHYMCQESLIEYLITKTKLGRSHLEQLVKHKDVGRDITSHLKIIDEELDRIKICDPAIGSGAFPMGLLLEIFAIKEVLTYELGRAWDPSKVKESIIQNSIYGVDNERGAVDIARLRFWLSLIVDDDKPRALPNLDYRIVAGDSLVSKFENETIEIDWDRKQHTKGSKSFVERTQSLLQQIANSQKKFFRPGSNDKRRLHTEIRNLKLELLINQLSFNKERFIASNPETGGFVPTPSDIKHNTELLLTKRNFDNLIAKLQRLIENPEQPFVHFDWKLDFPDVLNPNLVLDESGRGFDIVVGNPPYIEFKKLPAAEKVHFGKYRTANRKYDIFCLFVELSSLILKGGGIHCFINPTTFLMKDFGTPLRDLIKEEFRIIEILDFADYQIFESAVTYTGIFLFKKEKPSTEYTFVYQKLKSKEKSKTRELLFLEKESGQYKDVTKIGSSKLNEKSWVFGSEASSSVLMQIEGENPRLKTLTKYIFVGIQSGKDEVFFVNREDIQANSLETAILLPILKGKDVRKYLVEWSGTYIIYPYDKKTNRVIEEAALKANYPNVYSYLVGQKDNLKGRSYFDKSNKRWYELWCERIYSKFQEVKIVNAEISPENRFQIDYSGILGNTKIFSTVLKKEWKEYYLSLLAILNSSLMNFYHKQIASPKAGGFYDYKTQFIQNYPIKLPINKAPFDSLVGYIMFLNTRPLSSTEDQLMPSYFEQVIDGMVFELYFPDLLKSHGRQIIEHLGELPVLVNTMSESQKMTICASVFNRLDDKNHPVRTNLFYMSSIPEIKLMSDKNENN